VKPCRIEFPGTDKPPVELAVGDNLSEKLTIQNSPILFGCRIGICGTCAVAIVAADAPLPERTADEREYLEAMAPGQDDVRLACQIKINTNVKLRETQV
jgi:ferredoxin